MEQLPREAYDICLMMHERFAQECIDKHPGNLEEAARELTGRMVEQLLFSKPDEGYCWKSGDPNRPPSKDSVARTFNGFWGYDMYAASGANGPKFFNPYPPPVNDLSNPMQHVILPPEANLEVKNWLGLPIPVPVPPIPPPTVLLMEYANTVKRSDPRGFLMPFEAASAFPIATIELFMEGDGEPSIVLEFIPENKRDGRYCRALAWKPVVNGSWIPVVRAWDINGLKGEAKGNHAVTVTF